MTFKIIFDCLPFIIFYKLGTWFGCCCSLVTSTTYLLYLLLVLIVILSVLISKLNHSSTESAIFAYYTFNSLCCQKPNKPAAWSASFTPVHSLNCLFESTILFPHGLATEGRKPSFQKNQAIAIFLSSILPTNQPNLPTHPFHKRHPSFPLPICNSLTYNPLSRSLPSSLKPLPTVSSPASLPLFFVCVLLIHFTQKSKCFRFNQFNSV
jgi:hypothetical protein